MIYLDNSATTRVMPAAAEAAMQAMREDFFNPAAAYTPAAALEKRVDAVRKNIADSIGHRSEEIVFTSGGTESNNTAIFGALKPVRGKRRIITTVVEHPSVYEVFRSLENAPDTEVVYLPVDSMGQVALPALADALTENTALVSIMHVNNETGAINDIAGAYQMIRRASPSALFHVDGVQAFCKLPFSAVPCDLYSVSGHKFHAPKGVGVLYVRGGIRFAGGQIGGGQEQNRRSGTTNVPGILGMDAALSDYRKNQSAYLKTMRSCKLRLAQNLSTIPDVLFNGPAPDNGAGHILNVSFLGIRGEVLLHALSERQIYVATGSACSAHKKGKNRVLAASGITGPRQEGAIRFSFSPFNTIEEMDTAAEAIMSSVAFLRKYQRR